MNTSVEQRQNFSVWLRTGRWPRRAGTRELEFKFNPYHDPANGQFTTAAGSGSAAGFTSATRPEHPGSKVTYVSDPDKAPIATMAEADAWRAKELAEHGKDPEYVAAIEARYQTYRNAFSRSSVDGSPLQNTFISSVTNNGVATNTVGGVVGKNGGVGTSSRAEEAGSIAATEYLKRISSQLGLGPRQIIKQMGPLAAVEAEYIIGRGSNSRAFEDPMTLEQAVPELRNALRDAVIAVGDNLLDLTGPATAFKMQFLQDHANQLTDQIKALDPNWIYDELGPIDALGTPIITAQDLQAKVDDLRFQRAEKLARLNGNYRPLQVETLRFVQQRTDYAYDDAMRLLQAGRLTPRLSDQEAIGNYVDQQVRVSLRERYAQLNIDSAGKGPVRVNRREYDTSGGGRSYRRPDARVNEVAYDVTLARKTLATPQVRGFFNADFKPTRVIIIRPSQLGGEHTYIINRPEAKQ